MSSSDPVVAQATRSFGDYLQGAIYTLDPRDQQLMSLLGAGYFSEMVNPNLSSQRHTYEAGEQVEREVNDAPVGTESRPDSADRQRSRPRSRVTRRTRNNESGEGVRASQDGADG